MFYLEPSKSDLTFICVGATDQMSKYSDIAIPVVVCLWIVMDTFVLSAIGSGSATLVMVVSLMLLATWLIARVLIYGARHLRAVDVAWVGNFYQRLLAPAQIAAVALLFLSGDVLISRLGAGSASVAAERVMCSTTTRSPARVTIEQPIRDGHACFKTAQDTSILQVSLGEGRQLVSVGSSAVLAVLSGSSLVFGNRAYIFSATAQFGVIPKLERSSSVLGADANANGVRDDIEAILVSKYPQQAQRAAALQTAKAMQLALSVNKSDTAAVKVVDREISRGINCIYSKFTGGTGSTQPAQVASEIEAMISNTKPRLLAYLQFNKALDGTTSALSKGDTCE